MNGNGRSGIAGLFGKAAIKRLSSVETDASRSHQHEMNGVRELLEIFGPPAGKRKYPATFMYLTDGEGTDFPAEIDFSTGEGQVTWYDARERNPDRSAEYRLYYSSGLFHELAAEGDLLVVCFNGERVWMIVAESGTEAEHQLLWMFSDFAVMPTDRRFRIEPVPERPGILSGVENMLLEKLGMEIPRESGIDTERMIEHFRGRFPSTREFSAYARRDTGIDTSVGNPDEVLLRWWNREEAYFRALEKHIVENRLEGGFEDVDDFISFSLSVHNRRKSRAGQAFENHLEQIFLDHGLEYTRGGTTEGKSRPDFVFPSIEHYHAAGERREILDSLTVLGAKTTCKDRWRQITREAALIDEKHLVTLEPAISTEQTDEMKSLNVQLVVPSAIVSTYHELQRGWIMDLSSFIEMLQDKQGRLGGRV